MLGWHADHALSRVQLDGVLLQGGECFAKVIKECFFFLGLDDDVVNVYLNIAANFFFRQFCIIRWYVAPAFLSPQGIVV